MKKHKLAILGAVSLLGLAAVNAALTNSLTVYAEQPNIIYAEGSMKKGTADNGNNAVNSTTDSPVGASAGNSTNNSPVGASASDGGNIAGVDTAANAGTITTKNGYKDGDLIGLNAAWQYADYSAINSGNAVMYTASSNRKSRRRAGGGFIRHRRQIWLYRARKNTESLRITAWRSRQGSSAAVNTISA